jgi:ribosomal protein S6--L-glutamate ligase
VVAAIERTAAPGDYRANLHQGGVARKVRLDSGERKLAIAASRALGLTVCGVDIIRSSRGPLLLEVNSSPGLEGIEKATEKNVAGSIIEELERQLGWNASTKNVSSKNVPSQLST